MSKHFNPLKQRDTDDTKVSLGRATLIASTQSAVRVLLDSDGQVRWIPSSVVHEDSEVFRGCDGPGDLIVKSWWAEKEGLS